MSTFFATLQVVCYGVGIVSGSLSIARLVRRWHAAEAPFEGEGAGEW
jgi:hypothetical protein